LGRKAGRETALSVVDESSEKLKAVL
jgi:hypothetical protein